MSDSDFNALSRTILLHMLQSLVCRSQQADDRPSFSSIVDDLLEIIEEVPDSRNVEVSWAYVERCVLFHNEVFKLSV